MSRINVEYESDREQHQAFFSWPGVTIAVIVALIVAAIVTVVFSDKVSALKGLKDLFFKEKSEGKPAQTSTNSSCNAIVNFYCMTNQVVSTNSGPEKQPETIVARNEPPKDDTKSKSLDEPKITPPVKAADDTKSKSQKDELKKKQDRPSPNKMNHQDNSNALAKSTLPIYYFIGPNDDLSKLSIANSKPSMGLCGLKKYLPCYMPKSFGGMTIIRDKDDE